MAGGGKLLNGILSGATPGSRFHLFEGTDRMDRDNTAGAQLAAAPKPSDPSVTQGGVPASDPYRFQSPWQKTYTESEAYKNATPQAGQGSNGGQPGAFAGNGFMFPSRRNKPPVSTNLNALSTYQGV